MKKNYIKPDAFVVEIKQKCSILAGSGDPYQNYQNNGGMQSPVSDEGYSGGVRARQSRFYVDDWEEE